MVSVAQCSPLIGPDGGCPIHYYVIEYKEESQPTWRIVSNNIRYASALGVRAANDPSVFTITKAILGEGPSRGLFSDFKTSLMDRLQL